MCSSGHMVGEHERVKLHRLLPIETHAGLMQISSRQNVRETDSSPAQGRGGRWKAIRHAGAQHVAAGCTQAGMVCVNTIRWWGCRRDSGISRNLFWVVRLAAIRSFLAFRSSLGKGNFRLVLFIWVFYLRQMVTAQFPYIKSGVKHRDLPLQCVRRAGLLPWNAAMRQLMLICGIRYTSTAASISFKWTSTYSCVFSQCVIHPNLWQKSPSSGSSPKAAWVGALIYFYLKCVHEQIVYGWICLQCLWVVILLIIVGRTNKQTRCTVFFCLVAVTYLTLQYLYTS